jgi:hypothetical protein
VKVAAAAPAPKVVIARRPPTGWYADQTIDEDGGDEDEPTLSTATDVPSWQTQERERKWMVGITAALVVAALLWALWPEKKQTYGSLNDGPPRITARR